MTGTPIVYPMSDSLLSNQSNLLGLVPRGEYAVMGGLAPANSSRYTVGTGAYRINTCAAASLNYGNRHKTDKPRDVPVHFTADEIVVAKHHAYLARMVIEEVVPAEVSAKARHIWELARTAVPNLSVPAAVAYFGGPLHYTWDDGRCQVTAEIPADGLCEWYVSDRQSGEFDGGDFEPADGLPVKVITGLQRILNRSLWILT